MNENMIKIQVKEQEVYAYHGVYDREKNDGQKFIITTTVFTRYYDNFTDDIKHTLSYVDIADLVEGVCLSAKYDLIETVGIKIADAILQKFAIAKEVMVEVKKPDAPVGKKIKYPAVTITKKRHDVYISIGSNDGNRERNINKALNYMEDFCDIIRVADIIETKPWGGVKQADFLNTVAYVHTTLEPIVLLRKLQKVEKNVGRVKTVKWGPRVIDLDILLFDDLVTETGELIIPHIHMHLREFVLKPLNQIAPYAVHPILRKRVLNLLEDLEKTDV